MRDRVTDTIPHCAWEVCNKKLIDFAFKCRAMAGCFVTKLAVSVRFRRKLRERGSYGNRSCPRKPHQARQRRVRDVPLAHHAAGSYEVRELCVPKTQIRT